MSRTGGKGEEDPMAPWLFLIDVQRGFVNPWTEHVPPLAEALQDRFETVIATRFFNPEGSLHRRLIGWGRFAKESDDFPLAFEPRPGVRVIDKATYTAAGPEIVAELQQTGVSRVYIAGIATDNCVLKTAVDLFEAGIEPVVLAQACASHGGPECHEAGLMLLRRFIGEAQVLDGDPLTMNFVAETE
jgi:nicotinamidase-related amidase